MYNLKEIALLPVCAVNTLRNAWDGAANFISMEAVGTGTQTPEDYDVNGQFRFEEGAILDASDPEDGMFRGAKGWRVIGTLPALAQPDKRKELWHNDLRDDLYVIDVGNGTIERHFKMNIEYRMRPARRPATVAELTCRQN